MRNRENEKYVKIGITAAAVVAFGIVFYFMFYRATGFSKALRFMGRILRPFIVGGILAYLVTPLANKLNRLLGGKREGLANILAILIAVVIVLAILFLIVPQLVDSIAAIARALPGEIDALQRRITQMLQDDPELQAEWEGTYAQLIEEGKALINKIMGGDAVGNVAGKAMQIAGGVADRAFSVFNVLKDLLIGVIVSLYFLSKRAQLAEQAKLIVRGLFKPEWADWIEKEVRFADRMFNGFFVGKLLDSAIVGVICFVGCLLMGFKSPLLIAVIVGVTNIIPFFGPFIGAIPCALVLLLENPIHCLMFLVFVIVLQQIDGNIIGPKILGDSTGLSALWVMFGILLFGGLWGIMGMLIGVPLMAVIYDIIRQITFKGVRDHGHQEMIDRYNDRFHPPSEPGKGKGSDGKEKDAGAEAGK